MTTAAVDQDVELEQAIEILDEQIGKQRLEVAEWEQKERECNHLLADLQQNYIEAAGQRVMGKQAPTDVLAKQIDDLKTKSVGFAHVVATKRAQLSDLQTRLAPLYEQQTKRAQQRNLENERLAVEEEIAAATAALDDAERAALRFAEGLQALRSRVYLDEKTKSRAFDAAFALQRRSQGMRP